jgi:hypothetical protein
MEQEQSFLAALSKVERFGFRFGDLVLSGPGGTLVFSPRATGVEPLGSGPELVDPGDAGSREQ